VDDNTGLNETHGYRRIARDGGWNKGRGHVAEGVHGVLIMGDTWQRQRLGENLSWCRRSVGGLPIPGNVFGYLTVSYFHSCCTPLRLLWAQYHLAHMMRHAHAHSLLAAGPTHAGHVWLSRAPAGGSRGRVRGRVSRCRSRRRASRGRPHLLPPSYATRTGHRRRLASAPLPLPSASLSNPPPRPGQPPGCAMVSLFAQPSCRRLGHDLDSHSKE